MAAIAVEQGAQALFLPEYCGGLKTKGGMFAPPALPESSHPVLTGLRGFAKAHDVWISVGSLAVPGRAGKVINRSLLLDRTGAVVSRYDNLHLFDIQLSDQEVYRESARVTPGQHCIVSNVDWAVIGHSICYDLRFPNLYRDMAQAGAEVLIVPSAFTKKTGQAHWHVLNRARAIENGAFVVSACAVGTVEGGGEAYGHSLIINPWGEVVADAGAQRGVVHATIDLDDVAVARGKIPSLQHDRPYEKKPTLTEDAT